jgi:riboflavin kinase / FMN adenylyltransferase
MKIISGLQRIPRYANPVVALGVFDGVHAGHREIIGFCVRRARAVRGTSCIVTFWPHPGKEELLYSLSHRLRLFEEMGVDVCVVIRFTTSFSRMSPNAFIRRVLVGSIGAHLVCVGNNFRFGSSAAGTVHTLTQSASLFGFGIKIFPMKAIGAFPVSSTRIRKCVRRGELRRARRLLGRPVSVFGTVERGKAYGRELGFPTANVNPHHEVIPPSGVYVVSVILRKSIKRGVCYIGPSPEFLRTRRRVRTEYPDSVEVHILDFKKMMYGLDIEVQFLAKIRGRMEFPSPRGLAAQIEKDIHAARSWFSLHAHQHIR